MTNAERDDRRTALDLVMEEEARRLMEARMLPAEGKLSQEMCTAVRDAVKAYAAKHKISKKTIARHIGVTDSVVIEVLKDTYAADPDEHIRALNEWMEIDARRRERGLQRSFVETRVAKRLLGCAERTSQDRCISVAYGASGIGKSMVAQVLAERFPGSVYLRISTGSRSYSALRNLLAVRLKIRRATAATRGMSPDERIFAKLRSSERMIIIDEAHRISDGGLEFLRDIWDECGVPILMLATKDLHDRIRRDADPDHGQLASRIGFWCPLTKDFNTDAGGKNPLFTLEEIRRIFERDKVRFLPEARAYLQDVANTLGEGSLRLCEDILRFAVPLERAVRNLGHKDAVVISAAALRRAHAERRPEDALPAELEPRNVRRSAAAS